MNLEEYFKRLHRLAEQQKNNKPRDSNQNSNTFMDDLQ